MGRRQRALLLGTASCLAAGLLAPRMAAAEVATDGTMGRRVSLSGPNIEIGAELGQQRGGNLFHSFKKFDVVTGGRVAFTGPDGVRNVISRVTGGERSSIDGTLASDIPNADLYLINPAGILFGPNARLDVKGSFHASTAAELRLADGAVFSALDISGSTLTVAEPRAFGFLGAPPGAITVDASLLEVGTGKALSLVGGDVLLNGDGNGRVNDKEPGDSRPDGLADEPGTVRTQGGRVTLAALGGPGEVALADGAVTGVASGTVALSREASAVASGDGGGSVALRGGRILISGGSLVSADNLGDGPASGGISVAASELVDIRDAGQLRSSAVGRGKGGRVDLTTPRLAIDGLNISPLVMPDESRAGIFVRAERRSAGDAGALFVAAGDIELTNRAVVVGPTSGEGRAADLTLSASGHFRVADSRIAVNADDMAAARANAGSITISAGTLELSGNTNVLAVAENTQGNGGTLSVKAIEGLTIDGGRIAADTRGAGGAGQVDVQGRVIELRANGRIESQTRGRDGGGGAVTVHAEESLLIDDGTIRTSTVQSGAAGNVVILSPRIILLNGGTILSEAERGSGAAGTVQIEAGSLDVIGGQISTRSTADSSGAAGAVMINATGKVEVTQDGEINASTRTAGAAGGITLSASELVLTEGGRIRSATAGEGNAGTIRIVASDISIRGRDAVDTGITANSNARATGRGGDIIIEAESLELQGNDTFIRASTDGDGHGGSLNISAQRLAVTNGAAISSNAQIDREVRDNSTGNAGSVTVEAGRVDLFGGRITSDAMNGARGTAGSVTVTVTGPVTIEDRSFVDPTSGDLKIGEGELSSFTKGVGNAGQVSLTASVVNLGEGGRIGTSSSGAGSGAAGNIMIRAGMLTVEDASIGTEGSGAVGGSIDVVANDRILLRRAEITSNGIEAGTRTSVIELSAPQIVLDQSRVTSIIGSTIVEDSGRAVLDAEISVISADSTVVGSSETLIGGLQTNLGSDLQLSPSVFLDASGLLAPSCAERGAARSTFSRGGRGGLPPSPDRPLPSAGVAMAQPERLATAGSVILDACAGTLVRETNS